MDELKVVLHLKEGRALVGIQGRCPELAEGTKTDPVLETVSANSLEELLAAVPAMVTRARERWASSPLNPNYQRPVAPAPPPVPGRQPAASRGAPAPAVSRPALF